MIVVGSEIHREIQVSSMSTAITLGDQRIHTKWLLLLMLLVVSVVSMVSGIPRKFGLLVFSNLAEMDNLGIT